MTGLPVIVVHGGAGSYTTVFDNAEERAVILDGVRQAAEVGYKRLQLGDTAVDAVQAAVAYMEDSPLFNAGYGSYLTNECTVEMDAAIMDGASLKTGAVACITNVKNPIKVARLVMDKTKHVLFCGSAAKSFAEQEGIEIVSTESLITEKAIKRLALFKEFQSSVTDEFYEKLKALQAKLPTALSLSGNNDEHDTVGAVAVDCHGNVAYANSTGGISAKMCGRVGDSALVGCGGYADNTSGAVATTGHGEAFVRICTAKHAAVLIEQGKSPQAAIEEALRLMEVRVDGLGGCIAVNNRGEVGVSMTTEGMAWASIKGRTIQSGIFKNELHECAYCE